MAGPFSEKLKNVFVVQLNDSSNRQRGTTRTHACSCLGRGEGEVCGALVCLVCCMCMFSVCRRVYWACAAGVSCVEGGLLSGGSHGAYPPPPLYKLRPCPSYSRRRDRNNCVRNFNCVRNVVRPHMTWVCRHICQLYGAMNTCNMPHARQFDFQEFEFARAQTSP